VEKLQAAIDGRMENGVPLLVTTNLSLRQIAEKYPQPEGEAIASRLFGYCRAFRVDGVDRRMERAA
jgi:DNA replication protein DnaC